jgi:GNAT superfamily N-acetyltransferase
LSPYSPVEALASDHEVSSFDCGSEAQTDWLRRHAYQAHQSDTCKVYVVCRRGTRVVVGYYALAAGSVEHEAAPARVLKGVGRYPVPVIILTRLGVERTEQGRGLGSGLVRDALLQTAAVADRVGVRTLLIHCETQEARAFYERIEPAFEASPTDPLHLLLLIKDLREALAAAARLLAAHEAAEQTENP